MPFFTLTGFGGKLVSGHNPASGKLSFDGPIDRDNVIYIDQIDSIVKRYGSKKLNSTAINRDDEGPPDSGEIVGLHRYYNIDGTARWVVAMLDEIYSDTASAGTFVSFKENLTESGNDMYIKSFFDSTAGDGTYAIYMANGGTEGMMKWDLTTHTDNHSGPNDIDAGETPRRLEVHVNRLWAVGTNNPNRLYYSRPRDADSTWSHDNAGFIDFDTDDGESISQIISFGHVLVIFKESSIFFLYGSDKYDFKKEQLPESSGCVAPRSPVSLLGKLVFLGKDGFYALAGSQLSLISGDIQDKITAMVANQKVEASACRDGRFYRCHFSTSGTTNTSGMMYDVLLDRWFPISGQAAGPLFYADGKPDDGKVFYGNKGTTGFIYEANTGNNDEADNDGTGGTAISAFWQSKYTDLGIMPFYKIIKNLWVEADGSNNLVLVDIITDYANTTDTLSITIPAGSGALWGSAIWGAFTWASVNYQVKHTRVPAGVRGRRVSFKIKNAESGQGMIVRGLTTEFQRESWYV